MRIGGSESQAATRAARQIVMSTARMYRSSSEPIVPVARADASEIAVIGPDVSRFSKYFRQLSAARPPRLAPLQERQPLEQVHVLFVLQQGAVQGRDQALGVPLGQRFGRHVIGHQ